MEWYYAFGLILGGVLFCMFLGMPVAFAFLTTNALLFWYWGGPSGFERIISGLWRSVSIFTLLPIPLFILLSEVLVNAGIGSRVVDSLDKWLGRMPGRLGLLAVWGGSIIGALSGVGMATVAMVGKLLLPEMKRRNYSETMSLGPVAVTGAIDLLIPPSTLAVLLGAIAQISIGQILIGITIPGVMLTLLCSIYIIIRCWLQPSIAPPYETPYIPLRTKFVDLAINGIPVVIIIFLVTGVIFIGLATPSEAAATGAVGCFILAAAYGKFSWKLVKDSFANTTEFTAMILLIAAAAAIFSKNLALSGATQGLVEFITTLSVSPMIILVGMIVIELILGMFMEALSFMMITIPLFLPLVHALGFNEVWWAVVMLVAIVVGPVSPPFGLDLFVLKAVAPPGTTMGQIYRSVIPFIVIELIGIVLVVAFPALALWLPSLMAK
jgi:tripartite ATP-independent transporter DctM subunit